MTKTDTDRHRHTQAHTSGMTVISSSSGRQTRRWREEPLVLSSGFVMIRTGSKGSVICMVQDLGCRV